MRLTRSGKMIDGHHSAVYRWDGRDIRVRDDAETALETIELFKDERIGEAAKVDKIVSMWFIQPRCLKRVRDQAGLFAMLAWELCGLDIDGSHDGEYGEKVFDWEQDVEYIKVSLFNAYGRPWDEIIKAVPYRDLCALIGLAPHDTPIGQALYYRTAEPPKQTKHNKEQVSAWKERQAFWRLGGEKESSHFEAANSIADDMFASLSMAVRS